MFNGQAITVIAAMDLFFILVCYIIMRLVFKTSNKLIDKGAGEPDPRWDKLERIFNRFHLAKILYLLPAFLVVRANVEIISGALASDMQPIDVFGKINLLLVADAVVILVVRGITLFQKETEEG